MMEQGILELLYVVAYFLIVSAHTASGQASVYQHELCQANGSLTFVDESAELVRRVVRGKYMSLSCQTPANEACHTEWLKDDGIPYPFDFVDGESKGHVHLPGGDNQTLEIRNTQRDATGNYTCIVHNRGSFIQRTFSVTVLDYPYVDDPDAISNRNCTDMEVRPGEDVYLFCEFCVGDKAEQTQLQWFREEEEEQIIPISDLSCRQDPTLDKQYQVTCRHGRECLPDNVEPASIGKGLVIRRIASDLYGRYIITANYTLNGKSMKSSFAVLISQAPFLSEEVTISIAVSLAVLFVLVTTGTLLSYNYYLTVLLYWKNRYGKPEDNDGHEYDAFISYSDGCLDLSFALYLRKLLHDHGYQVWVRDHDVVFGSTLIAEEIESMKKSRRCILIISPDYATSTHSQVLTELAADQTLREESRIIPVLYRGVKKQHMQSHRRLVEMVRVLPCINWTVSSGGSATTEHQEGIQAASDVSATTEGIQAAAAPTSQSNHIVTGQNTARGGMRFSEGASEGDEDHLVASRGGKETKKMNKLSKKLERRLLLKMPPKRNVNLASFHSL